MAWIIAFFLLVNVFVPLLFQCSSKKRPPVQRPTRPSRKSSRSSRSRSKSRRSSKSSRSNSRRSSKSRSRSRSKSVKSHKLIENPANKPTSNKRVRAAILADQKAAEEAVKPKEQPKSDEKIIIDGSEESKKISYANVRIIPHELSFRPIGGLKHVRVKNSTGKRIAFMVKCSDNMLFSINPVYGLIEADRDAQINILRENAEAKHDKIVIITAPEPNVLKSAEETFNNIYNTNSHDYNISVLPLLAEE